MEMLNWGGPQIMLQNVIYALPPYIVVRLTSQGAGVTFNISNDIAFGSFLSFSTSQNDIARSFIRMTSQASVLVTLVKGA